MGVCIKYIRSCLGSFCLKTPCSFPSFTHMKVCISDNVKRSLLCFTLTSGLIFFQLVSSNNMNSIKKTKTHPLKANSCKIKNH